MSKRAETRFSVLFAAIAPEMKGFERIFSLFGREWTNGQESLGSRAIAHFFLKQIHRFWGQAHLIFLIEFAQQIRNASLSGRRALQVSK